MLELSDSMVVEGVILCLTVVGIFTENING